MAVVVVVLWLTVLLGVAGMVLDVGALYHARRQLQASADAAALAGASQLPDAAAAGTVAKQYGTAGKNKRDGLGAITETISARCVTALTGCYPSNAVNVTESAQVPTAFLRLFGINSVKLTAQSTACGPCGGRPADIVLIFDRTLSMCMDYYGNQDSSCGKLNNARAGMQTLIRSLDPKFDRVALATLPPASSTATACTAPPSTVYDNPSAAWLLVPLAADYIANGQLNQNSKLVQTVACLPAAGQTAYANAIDAAQAELNAHGRPNTEHAIVFFTDGAANTGPTYYPKLSPYREQPCHQGITSAAAAKARGTTVYSIGYALNANGGGANRCTAQTYFGPDEQPPITAYQALSQIATSASTFYNEPTTGSLNGIFAAIATQLTGPRLIRDDLK
jgi:Flp pilus assembly protein TadG